MNQWVSMGIESWLPSLVWDGCGDPVDYASLSKRRCFIGVDFSSSIDITAVVCFFEPLEGEKIWDMVPFFWVPGKDLVSKSRADHMAYDVWGGMGFVYFEGKEAIDFKSIEIKILELDKQFNIVGLGFDPWRSKDLIDNLQKQGGFEERAIPIPQQYSFMSDATQEIQRKAHMKELRHGNNPVLRTMSENTKLIMDSRGNRMIDKKRSRTRIDGISALIIAQAVATKFKGTQQKSIYDPSPEHPKGQGIFFLDDDEDARLTPLQGWAKRFGMTEEEVLVAFPDKFDPDGNLKT